MPDLFDLPPRIGSKTNIRIGPNWRQGTASFMLQQGVHPKIVQEHFGHSDNSLTLNTFSHPARHAVRCRRESGRIIEAY